MSEKVIPISIVVPVYNTAKYLRACLNSLLTDPLKDCEIICIDDCSADTSLHVLRAYEKRYKQIHVIANKKKLGSADSRNLGISLAKGEYITTLDSDDYFDPIVIWEAYLRCKQYNSDVVYWRDPFLIDDRNYALSGGERQPLYVQRVISRDNFISTELKDTLFYTLHWYTQSRLVSKKFILEHALKFHGIARGDDLYFGCAIALLAKRVTYLDKSAVYYRTNREGQLSAGGMRDIHDAYNELRRVRELVTSSFEYEHALNVFYSVAVNCLKDIMDISFNISSEQRCFFYFMREIGWKELKLDSCTEKTFFNRADYKLYKRLRNYIGGGIISKKATVEDDFSDCFDEYCNEICLNLKKMNYKYCIWGYGKHGKVFADKAIQNKVPICAIVDRAISLKGKKVHGLDIQPLREQKIDAFSAIIITNSTYGMDIVEELAAHSYQRITLIDIDFFIHHQVSWDSCVYSLEEFRRK